MKRCRILLAAVLAGVLLDCFQVAAQGTAFTYQGRLNDAGGPASGNYDLKFLLFDSSSGGGQTGNSFTNVATAVSNGLFVVALDFGTQFTGNSRWLEISVRTNGGAIFTTLAPRQPLTPVPYAIYAANASNVSGSVSASQISGAISLAQLPPGVVTNGGKTTLTYNSLTAAYATNELYYAVTMFTNPVYFGGSAFDVNTYFWWNTTRNLYTNQIGQYLFYNENYEGYVVQTTTNYDGVGTGFIIGDQSGMTRDITQIFGGIGNIWADFSNTPDSAILSGNQTNVFTNTILAIPNGQLQISVSTNQINGISIFDTRQRLLYSEQYVSNSTVSFVAPHYSVVSNTAYTVATVDGNGGAGLQNYWLNLNNQTLQSNDKRFAVGIGAMFGTNGMFGGSMEFLNLRDLNFNDSPQQSFTLFWHPLKLNPDGSVTTGNNPISEHGLDYIFTNAWHTERAGTLSRPQLYLEPSPRPTNTFKGGQIWFETNSVKSDMMFSPTNGVVFPIPQMNQTNATVSGVSTFTWTFVYPFSDTNYSVSVNGGGTSLGNLVIGAKTMTNVVVTFSPFTGILNLLAVRQ